MRGDVFRAGRDPENDLVIEGPEAAIVSSRHFEIRRSERTFRLIDLGSTNGTLHNVERVIPGVARELADGDIIVLARLVLTLRIVHSPQDELPLFSLEHLPNNIKAANPIRSSSESVS